MPIVTSHDKFAHKSAAITRPHGACPRESRKRCIYEPRRNAILSSGQEIFLEHTLKRLVEFTRKPIGGRGTKESERNRRVFLWADRERRILSIADQNRTDEKAQQNG